MGHLLSKPVLEDEGDESKIITSEDPRSPTPDINRTPIQKLDGNKSPAITKNINLTKECFEKFDKNAMKNPALKALMEEIDPRSPTIEFQRTPLAVLIKNPELLAKYNERSFTDALDDNDVSRLDDPNASSNLIFDNCQRNLNKDLGNASAISVHDEENTENVKTSDSEPSDNERRHIPGLLETNLDYIETDLDTVRRKPKPIKVEKPKTITVENKYLTNLKDLSGDDPRSPSVDIKRTPIVLLDKDEETKPDKSEIHTKMQELFEYNMGSVQKHDVKMTDGNLEFLLIYEDHVDDKMSTPVRKATSVQKTESSRTPLASMVNVHKTITKQNIELENKNTRKSKIPIKVKKMESDTAEFPKKLISKRIPIESIENTPPKARQARWDQNNSVIL